MIKEKCTCDCRENDEEDEDGESDSNSSYEEVSHHRHVDLASCVKFCRKSNRLCIPFKPDTFTEFLKKAEIDLRQKANHTNTTQSAQEELMTCLGLILKDRLQKLWREKKIEELVYYLILKIVPFPTHVLIFLTLHSVVVTSYVCFPMLSLTNTTNSSRIS